MNLNGIAADDFVKISLIQGYITERNIDVICLSETYLNSSLNKKDDKLNIEGYNLIRSDHRHGLKKGGICVYYEEYVPFIRRDDLCTLDNCLVAEIRLENEKCFFACLYRSPNQSQHKFEDFCTKLDFLANNINNELLTISVITGDFNARCSKWFNKDITNSGCEIVSNSFSCINLIFCINQNLI